MINESTPRPRPLAFDCMEEDGSEVKGFGSAVGFIWIEGKTRPAAWFARLRPISRRTDLEGVGALDACQHWGVIVDAEVPAAGSAAKSLAI